jgi:hypothetical protein
METPSPAAMALQNFQVVLNDYFLLETAVFSSSSANKCGSGRSYGA